MQSARLQLQIGGTATQGMPELLGVQVSAFFDSGNVQPAITSDTFELVNEARQAILAHIQAGRIFEGLSFKIIASNSSRSVTIFDGFFDFREHSDNPDTRKFTTRIMKRDALGTISERAQALTFGSMYDRGLITDSDFVGVDYVVEEPFDPLRVVTVSVTLYLLVKDLQDTAYNLAEGIATAAGILSAGVTGSAGAAIYTGLRLAAQIAVFAVKIVALIRLADQLVNLLFPIQRQHKAATLRTLLTRSFAALGYEFRSNIAELDTYVYLASNTNLDQANVSTGFLTSPGQISVGIPNIGDFGYRVNEMFDLCRRLFRAAYYLDGNTVTLAWVEDPTVKRVASYTLPDVGNLPYRYNTDELTGNKILSFEYDSSDIWTIEDFGGTNYEIRTAATGITDQRTNLVRGQADVRFEVALGSRKSGLSAVESALAGLFSIIDQLAGVFGGSTGLSNFVTERIGLLRVSQNNTTKPKLLVLEGNRIPANHRERLSAKYLYEKYHFIDSFVLADGIGQAVIFENVRVPFGLEAFTQLIANSWAKDAQGRDIQITRLDWEIGADRAVISYRLRQRYTDLLTETYRQG
jgi:hypothetical protein